MYRQTHHKVETKDELYLFGNVDVRQVELAFNSSERIAEVLVEEGDSIKKGQLISKLELERFEFAIDRDQALLDAQRQVIARLEAGSRPEEIRKARADVEAAKASARDSEQRLQRIIKLVPTKAATQQDLDDAQAAALAAKARTQALQATLDLAIAGPRKEDIAEAKAMFKRYEAELALAKHDLNDAHLYSPSNGIVQERILEVGDMASPQKTVYTIALTDPVWVRAYVTEPDPGKISEVTGLIGPDGAGKTTAMRLAAGLFMPDSGTVHVLGMDVSRDARAIQASVGYMPQRFGLYEDLTVQENLDLYADLHGVPHSVRAARYQELLEMTGMAPFSKRLAGKLSGGMKQKLGLACVLVHPPALLLLDEPTVGVDPVSRRELWQIVDRFVQDEGTTVLVSTGYMDEAERCDQLFLLDEGKILSEGSPSSLSNPLRGMTFRVRGEGINRRKIQSRLEDCKELADTVIQGEWVRVVTRDIATNPCQELFPKAEQVTIEPVSPRIEDAFVTLLGAQRQANPSQSRPSARMQTAPARSSGSQHSATNSPVIRVQRVERGFGDFYAVKGISFDVQRGEIFGLLGANGAGKTTMFRMLCGLLPASAGELDIVGVDVRRNPAKARERIGYMAQKFSLYGSLSVLDNLRFFSSAYRLQGRNQQDRINWALDQFELREVANMNSADLPLGFKQRLSFACALMHQPEILFLDEPTSGVDPLARREFWRRTNALAAEGVTVLVTTHFMEEADNCDRVAIMVQGEILALGTPRSIKQQAEITSRPEPSMEEAFVELISARQIEAPA